MPGRPPLAPVPALAVSVLPEALPGLGLGLDVGGTQTRWALAWADGQVLAEGAVAGFSGPQLASASGRREVLAALAALRQALALAHPRPPMALWAGITGHDASAGPGLPRLLARALSLPVAAVRAFNDVELAARICFAPGQGYLVYAGTGSIGWFIDAQEQAFHVGGRGGLLGDEGSGYWLARQALAALWRSEDDAPGLMAATPLGRHLHAALGGADWDTTRRVVHQCSRGELGALALAVAAAATEGDAVALQLLLQAGAELARLANILRQRFGQRPVVLAGRAAALHPVLAAAMQAALLPRTVCKVRTLAVHREAAVSAARRALMPASGLKHE